MYGREKHEWGVVVEEVGFALRSEDEAADCDPEYIQKRRTV